MVLFFAAVDYYVYYTVPCSFFWLVFACTFLTTMFITRYLVVFFGLFLLALAPFALKLKYEVGVWVKLT